ncbi:MAG: 4-hydroxy-tetrahydrodipicolinate reductase [Chloroflexi bacterium]|nr:4-hydroxy-tetrahydrodipicolinate reductase [Chloroflexota bacterium]
MKAVVVSGLGNMGKELIKTLENHNDFKVAGIIEPLKTSDYFSTENSQYQVFKKPEDALNKIKVDIVVDFTNSEFTEILAPIVLRAGINLVVGTSNLSENTLKTIQDETEKNEVGCVVAPNFALGAVLMMYFSKKAAPFYNTAEIIEKHHDQKVDSPSGTAMETAKKISDASKEKYQSNVSEQEKLKNARGATFNGINIHSIRLPGVVANQEVIFSAEQELLLIEHQTTGRKSFMPGVILALEYVNNNNGYIVGLEKVIGIE